MGTMLETSNVLVGVAVLFGVLVLLTLYLQIGHVVQRRKGTRKTKFLGGADSGGHGVQDIPDPKNLEEQQWVLELLLDRAGSTSEPDQWQEIRQVAANKCGKMLHATLRSRKSSDRLYALVAIYRLGLRGFGRAIAKIKPRNGLEGVFKAAIMGEKLETADAAGSINELSLGSIYEAIQATEQKRQINA